MPVSGSAARRRPPRAARPRRARRRRAGAGPGRRWRARAPRARPGAASSRRVERDDQLAAALVGGCRARSQKSYSRARALDAQARLERARLVVDAGVDDAASCGRSGERRPSGSLLHHDDGAGRAGGAAARAAAASPTMPAPTTATSWTPEAPFCSLTIGEALRRLVPSFAPCGCSSPAPPAPSAPTLVPHLRPRRPRAARLRARRRRASRSASTALAEVVHGDAVTGAGLDAALDGVDVAYFLIHSMETVAAARRRLRRARPASPRPRLRRGGAAAGVRRVVYLGGLVPATGPPSAHLASRLEVEEILLAGAPEAVALRASIVIGARSRSFRFLVRLVERVPVMPLPAWRDNRTQPIDGRDVLAYLAAAATSEAVERPVSARHRRPGRAHLRRARRPHPRCPAGRRGPRCACPSR